MGDQPSEEKPAGLPQPPVRSGDLFHAVFVLSRSVNAEPGQQLLAEARTYGAYVRQLGMRLEAESRRLAARVRDEATLVRAAAELMQAERQRGMAMQPYLAAPAEAVQKAGWPVLMARLRDDMARELEALRDARLRLELRRAELINQHKGAQVRIVLRGGAQVRLHLSRRTGHAAEKG